MSNELNKNSLDTLCASLAYAMGITPPAQAAEANEELNAFIDSAFGGEKCDRVFMYNPDAIGQWIFEKYQHYVREVKALGDIEIPLRSVMPSVTPVCFGTMYTGAQPEVHGIQKYEKPVIKIDTLFDALLRAGKKCALITTGNCSLAKIYLERDMDYFNMTSEASIDEANAKAAELILRDEHDFILVYNGNYDSRMHRSGPESYDAISELRANSHAYAQFCKLIEDNWTKHNTLVGFAMDHGCHAIDGDNEKEYYGSHGLDMPEDLNILHTYKAIKAAK